MEKIIVREMEIEDLPSVLKLYKQPEVDDDAGLNM